MSRLEKLKEYFENNTNAQILSDRQTAHKSDLISDQFLDIRNAKKAYKVMNFEEIESVNSWMTETPIGEFIIHCREGEYEVDTPFQDSDKTFETLTGAVVYSYLLLKQINQDLTAFLK